MARKECLIYMKGNPGGIHSFPLTTLLKTMHCYKTNHVIIAFYICGVFVAPHCWYSRISNQEMMWEQEKYLCTITPIQLFELLKISVSGTLNTFRLSDGIFHCWHDSTMRDWSHPVISWKLGKYHCWEAFTHEPEPPRGRFSFVYQEACLVSGRV